MGSFADYLENALLDHVFGGPDFTRPATVYVGLSTTTINDAGGNITEPVGNGYARVVITNNSTNFPAASGGLKTNGTAIQFPAATGAWGQCTDFFISTAASGGNILGYDLLRDSGGNPLPKSPTSGDTVRFEVGSLDINLT